MSQQLNDACHEGEELWLPIVEYSVRSGLSLSTIRRKIKSNSIPSRLEGGKYLLLVQGEEKATQQTETHARRTENHEPVAAYVAEEPEARISPSRKSQSHTGGDLEMVSGAFEHALREKEARINLLEKRNRDLEERLSELRLLIQVLEEKYEVRY